MKKAFLSILKVIILLVVVLIFGIGLIVFIGALSEKPPEHPLDFQDVNDIALPKSIHSVEDALPYALNRAYEWRKDAVLTAVKITSATKEEIENKNGKLMYYFECDYIDDSKPPGIMRILIDTNLNSIILVGAVHEYDDSLIEFSEMKTHDLKEKINRVYDVAIKEIGKDTIFQYEKPFVRVHIDSEFAIFEVSSEPKRNMIKHSVKIDMQTYEILSRK